MNQKVLSFSPAQQQATNMVMYRLYGLVSQPAYFLVLEKVFVSAERELFDMVLPEYSKMALINPT